MNKEHFMHDGIKGMKWGLRRFQYEDGTLTPLGKKRYGTQAGMYKEINKVYGSVDELKNRSARNVENLEKTGKVLDTSSKIAKDASQIGANSKKSKAINKKDYSDITDEEIRRKINRINMERTYGELTGDTKRVRSGEDWTREILQTTGAVVGIGASVASIVLTIVTTKKAKKGGNP